VGALIHEGPPLVANSIPPDHQIPIQQGKFGGTILIQIIQVKHGIPGFSPIKPIWIAAPCGQWLYLCRISIKF
jgi:hypothetical protein